MCTTWGFSRDSVVKNPPAVQELQGTLVQSLGRENPLEEGMTTHSSILAWRTHGQRSLADYSPRGCKESDTTEKLSTQASTNKYIYIYIYFIFHI